MKNWKKKRRISDVYHSHFPSTNPSLILRYWSLFGQHGTQYFHPSAFQVGCERLDTIVTAVTKI